MPVSDCNLVQIYFLCLFRRTFFCFLTMKITFDSVILDSEAMQFRAESIIIVKIRQIDQAKQEYLTVCFDSIRLFRTNIIFQVSVTEVTFEAGNWTLSVSGFT